MTFRAVFETLPLIELPDYKGLIDYRAASPVTEIDLKGSTVITVRSTETIKGAADRMRLHAIAALVVKSDDAVTGIISDRDIIEAISRYGEAALSMSVSDFATHAKITVSPDDNLKRAMSLMTNHRVRHLLVMTEGRLVGIVSIGLGTAIGYAILTHVFSCAH